ncbi:MAG: HNH endonuclease [Burkholderiales bacterium]|nr:HNH endonuclease [Burkholderiales bacterium]
MGRIYDKQQWKRLRRQQLRREPLCRMCLDRGITMPAVDVDHIIPIADGGEPWALENLRSLCHDDHSRVTRASQTGREIMVKGCDARGYPIDPKAWR